METQRHVVRGSHQPWVTKSLGALNDSLLRWLSALLEDCGASSDRNYPRGFIQIRSEAESDSGFRKAEIERQSEESNGTGSRLSKLGPEIGSRRFGYWTARGRAKIGGTKAQVAGGFGAARG